MKVGFGEEQISSLNKLAKTTPVGQSERREFSIVYQGRNTTLRVEFKRDDEDALDVWFFTTPELAKMIQRRLIESSEQ